MPDDPLEADFEIVRRLKHLSIRFRKGWEKLHPITEKHLSIIKNDLPKEWEKGLQENQSAINVKGKKRSKQNQQEKELKKTLRPRSKGKGQSHSQ